MDTHTMSPSSLIDLIRKTAGTYAVDGDLAVAIGTRESQLAWPRMSSRFEPAYQDFLTPEAFAMSLGISVSTEKAHQATSWGPLHILGAVARERGFRDALPLLFQPEIGVQFAVMHLQWLGNKFENESALIAAYNGGPGAAKPNPDGTYRNQDYVDYVTMKLKILRSIGN